MGTDICIAITLIGIAWAYAWADRGRAEREVVVTVDEELVRRIVDEEIAKLPMAEPVAE